MASIQVLLRKEYIPDDCSFAVPVINSFLKLGSSSADCHNRRINEKRIRMIANQWTKELHSLIAYAKYINVDITDYIYCTTFSEHQFDGLRADTLPIHYPMYEYLKKIILYKASDGYLSKPYMIANIPKVGWTVKKWINFCNTLPGWKLRQ